MIRAGVLILAMVWCGSARASAEPQPVGIACVDDDTFIGRFADRLGWVQLNRRQFPALIGCLVSLDGTSNAELAEFMPRMYAALLKADPSKFIHTMAQHPIELQHWLDNLGQAFVWDGDPPSPMEDERLELVSLVQTAHVEAGDTAVRDRILERLLEVRPRTID